LSGSRGENDDKMTQGKGDIREKNVRSRSTAKGRMEELTWATDFRTILPLGTLNIRNSRLQGRYGRHPGFRELEKKKKNIEMAKEDRRH